MVSRGHELLRQIPEYRFAVVLNLARLAVHNFLRANHPAAERRSDGLMSQAHSQDWNFSCEALDERHADSGFFRRTRAGRNHNAFRPQILNLVQSYLVIAADFQILPHLAEILRQVVGKRIVVVEQQNHFCPACPLCAISSAAITARALFIVS